MKARIFLLTVFLSIFMVSVAFAAINIQLQVFEGPRTDRRLNQNLVGSTTQPPIIGGRPERFNIGKDMAVQADADYQLKITGLNSGPFKLIQERIWPTSFIWDSDRDGGRQLTAPQDSELTGTFNAVKTEEDYELWKIQVIQGAQEPKLYFYLVKNDPLNPSQSIAKNPSTDCRGDRTKCQYRIKFSQDGIDNPTIADPTKQGKDKLDFLVQWNKLYCPTALKSWGENSNLNVLPWLQVEHNPPVGESKLTTPWDFVRIANWREQGSTYRVTDEDKRFKPHKAFAPLGEVRESNIFITNLLSGIKKGTYVAQIISSELSGPAEFSVAEPGGGGSKNLQCNPGFGHEISGGVEHPHTGGSVTDQDGNPVNATCSWRIMPAPANIKAGSLSTCAGPTYTPALNGTYNLQLSAEAVGYNSCTSNAIVEKASLYQCYFGFCYECNQGKTPPNCKVKNSQVCKTQINNACSIKIRE